MTITREQSELILTTLVELWADQHGMTVESLTFRPRNKGEDKGTIDLKGADPT